MAILTALAVPTFTGMIPAVQSKADQQTVRYCTISNELDKLVAPANGTQATPEECAVTP
jgi:hypothetical protein